ncbi:MAG: hypothetical protein ACTSRW_12600 [Candidatus Helarchaeota archaeon]
MCNYCKCTNMDRCSIRGTVPIGFCCEKCDFVDLDVCSTKHGQLREEMASYVDNLALDERRVIDLGKTKFRISLLHGDIKSMRVYEVEEVKKK